MAGKVHSRDLFLHIQLVRLREVLRLIQSRLSPAGGIGRIEEAHLSLYIPALVSLQRLQHPLHGKEHLPAVVPQAVQGAAFHQALNGAAVQIPAGHALTEIVKGGKVTAAPALLHHAGNDAPAQIFHRQQAEADAFPHHGEAAFAVIDMGRQHRDLQPAALLDVFRHLAGLSQHAGQQRRHILAGIVALQVGGLVSHHRIACRVGLIEGVGGKIGDLLKQLLSGLLVHAPAEAALDLHGAILSQLPVDEHFPFPFQHIVLLFGHRPADNVRPAQGVARQVPENLHHLLLVDDAAAGRL